MAISAPFLVANAGWFEGDVYEVGSVPQLGAGGEDRGDHVDGHPLHAEGCAAGFEEMQKGAAWRSRIQRYARSGRILYGYGLRHDICNIPVVSIGVE